MLYINHETLNNGKFQIICSSYEQAFLEEKNKSARSHAAYLLKTEPLRLFFSKNYPFLSNTSVITNKMLASLPLTLYCDFESQNAIFSDSLEMRGIQPHYKFISNNMNLCYDYVLKGEAACLSTALMFNSTFHPLHLSEVTSLPLQEKIIICHVLFIKKSQITKPVELFLHYFKKQFLMQEI